MAIPSSKRKRPVCINKLYKNTKQIYRVCIYFRLMIKEQKTSKIFQYDSPPELLVHEERLGKSETIANNTT